MGETRYDIWSCSEEEGVTVGLLSGNSGHKGKRYIRDLNKQLLERSPSLASFLSSYGKNQPGWA